MSIEDIIEKIREIEEGVNDPSIFKAVFLAGGPGSGKSFIVGRTALTSLGMRVVNSDPAFEKALAKAGLKMEPDDIFSPAGQTARGRAKILTSKQQSLYIKGRLGLIIDGTGKDYNKISKQKSQLEKLGYETAMIFVNTNLETAIARDAKRKRTLGSKEVENMWSSVQNNIGKFQNIFKSKMFIVDNSDGADFDRDVMRTYRAISAWANKTPANKAAQKWIDGQKAKRNVTEVLEEEMHGYELESAEMMLRQLRIMQNKITELADELQDELRDKILDDFDVEPWIASKVTKAKDYIDSVYDYTLMDMDDD